MRALKRNTVDIDSGALERLFALSPAILCIADTDANLLRVNPAFRDILGYTEEELLSRPFIDFVHPDDREMTMDEVRKLSEGESVVHFENRYRHADGSYRWLLWNTSPVVEEGLMYATAVDVSARKEADERWQELQQESAQRSADTERRLQAMANRLVLAEETERRRIARGLHDDVGQSLMVAKITIDELENSVEGGAKAMAREARQLLEHAIQSTRSLSFDLAAAALYDVGLIAALQSLCERSQQRSGILMDPPHGVSGKRIPEPVRVILYRIARELIQNVVRHSKARAAKLTLSRENGIVTLTVKDDGCGFGVEKETIGIDDAMSGFGLFSIRQQLSPIGGKLHIDSSAGRGTRVTVTVPIDTAESAA